MNERAGPRGEAFFARRAPANGGVASDHNCIVVYSFLQDGLGKDSRSLAPQVIVVNLAFRAALY